jgi:hypothetical protein
VRYKVPADFSKYIDLRIFDAEPGDIYLEAIEQARLTLPEFNLRVGTPEDAIFQAASYISALSIAAINRLPDRLMEGIVSILGFARQQAIAAEVDVTITLDTYSGGTVPSGTIFSYETLFEDEVTEFVFQTTNALVIPELESPEPGDPYPSASVTVSCLTAGIIPPITTPGTELKVLSSGTNILSVETFANFANGINADEDSDYLSRAATYLRSLSSALNKATQVDSYVLTQYPDIVGRVKTYDLTDGDVDLGDISVSRTASIIQTFLTGNLATVETDDNHLFVVGDVVTLENCGVKFNGERTITGRSDTTFSFVSVNTNSASTVVSGTASAGVDVAGEVTSFVYGLNSFLSTEEKNTIFLDVSEKSVAGLSFTVRDPDLLTLEITASIVIDSAFDQDILQENIENTIVDYLSPANFPYTDDRVRKTRLISLVSRIPGVIYVESMTLTGTNSGWLPQYGDDIIFLNKGSLPIVSTADLTFTYTLG